MLNQLQRLQKRALLAAITDELTRLEQRPRLTNYLRRRRLERLGERLIDELGEWVLTEEGWRIASVG